MSQLQRRAPLRSTRVKPRRKSPTVIDLDEARRLYDSGLGMRAVAAELGCNAAALSRALGRTGLKARSAQDYAKPIDEDLVVRLYLEGRGFRSVARLAGVENLVKLRAVLKRRGVLLPAHRPKGRKNGSRDPWETEFERMRPIIRRRSGGRCEAPCSPSCTGRAAHVHHRKLRGQGGGNRECDLLDLCRACHHWLHVHPAEAYERGLLVRSWDDPAGVPVL